MSMELCSRCHGGEINAPNCPVCGGSGFVSKKQDVPRSKPKPQGLPLKQAQPFQQYGPTKDQGSRKRRGIRVLKVKPTAVERRKTEQQALEAKIKAQQQARAEEVRQRKAMILRSLPRYESTPEGVVLKPAQKRRVERMQLSSELPQAPQPRKVRASKWSSPEHSRHRREALEAKLAQAEAARQDESELPRSRDTRKAQSAKLARNTQLADQLSSLLGSGALAKPSPSLASSQKLADKNTSDPSNALPEPKPVPSTPKASADQKTRATDATTFRESARMRRKLRAAARRQEAKAKARERGKYMKVEKGRLVKPVPSCGQSESRMAVISNERAGGTSKGLPGGGSDSSVDGSQPPLRSGTFELRHSEEDGGRYLGQSFREESGRFGSLPLYDDYDE